MENGIKLQFPITPVAKARPRLGRSGHTYTPQKTRKFETIIQQLAKVQYKGTPLDGPLRVEIEFRFHRPKTSKRFDHTIRPDIDNLCKGVFDALNGIIWIDDCQIIAVHAVKAYAISEGVTVTVLPV